jgi:hypothetical protein
MALPIETFRNADLSQGWRPGNNAGGMTLFKALGHPKIAEKARDLTRALAASGPVALVDPDAAQGAAACFHAFYGLPGAALEGYYVQRAEDLGAAFLGHEAKPLSALPRSPARTVFVASFDCARWLKGLEHLLPRDAQVLSFDALRLPESMLTRKERYLDPLNFATNFALLRDIAGSGGADGLHMRVTTANYWSLHGAADPALWLCLFDESGNVLAEWTEPLPAPGGLIEIDSKALRARFKLADFTGSLFMHAVHAAGHEIVKYALDAYGEGGRALSCNHDANAWPADFYAGMPAPDEGETLTLFIQNSHPAPIRPRSIGLNIMGAQDSTYVEAEVPPFGTHALDVGALLPQARFPDQIEISAGRHFVRPRYEVLRRLNGTARRRIAHANVERTDLKPDPSLPRLSQALGKGYIMPLPIPPRAGFATVMIPTPMARAQSELPLKIAIYDADGVCAAERYLGRIARRQSLALDIDALLAEEKTALPSGYGHAEFLYDFRKGGEADGWLHALARFEQKKSGHRAETIFGAHIYNIPVIYKDEPQSYVGRPPGLTTRLFLRIGNNQAGDALDTICHLIYPASLPWHPKSATALLLHDRDGRLVAERMLAIPCGGSRFFSYRETFLESERARAGAGAYVIIRDTTCRLFGFHGLLNGDESFCLDHMFGF